MVTQLELRVLGPVDAVLNGRCVDLGGSRQRRLLAGLVIDAGEVVSADRLAGRVWSDGELPEDPRRTLRTYMTRLRAALAVEDVITTEPDGWRLDAQLVSIDTRRFDEMVGQAGDPGKDNHQRLALLDEALGLWSGPAFGDLTDEDWLRGEVDRLEELRLTAIERRFGAMLALGLHTDVLPALAGEIEAYPLRERLVGQQMVALYRAGRQAEATRVFQTYRNRLVEELGLEPSARLVELDRRIVAADPTLDLTTPGGRALRGYRLGEQVGEGAFAVVYRGTQPSVGREVAVKLIRAELANRPEFVRRFETEAHLVARLEHPYIVPLYDYWREPDRACLVFRYLRGGTLEARLTARGALSVDECQTMVTQVGAALTVAHDAGVVHRDVKPANVFLDEAGNFYLGDFGIALDAAERSDPTAALSAGSPAYASPEQLRREPVGPTADVHGLGVSIYEALTARLPFPEAASHAELLQRQLHDPIPSVRDQRNDIPSSVDEILERATAKNPTERYQHIDELVADFVAAFESGPSAIAMRMGAATTVSAEARNPYKGLRAFTEADASDFRGRERLVDQLVEMLGRTDTTGRVAAVVGPSGIGKSSVVRAGLLPALHAGAVPGSDRWFVATMLPGSDPFEELAAALLRVATQVPENLMGQLVADTRGIARILKALVPNDSNNTVLLIIDQFEELFTLVEDNTVRDRFLAGLEHALTDTRCPLRVVLTIRADFWDRPLRYGSFARLIEHSTTQVTALAPDELERAIVEPALRVGCELEPGLVPEIVADVTDQPGALPLLQYALTELYDQRVSNLLTRQAYQDLGGIAGALARRADDLYETATVDEQTAIRRLFGRLVTPGEGAEDTRRRVHRSELTDRTDADEIINRYGAARLLSFDTDPATREPTVEVAHEALIRQWPRLRTWLDDDRDGLRILRHLTGATTAWEATSRDDGELYRSGRLESAEEWAAEHGDQLTKAEREFLGSSIAHREAERTAQRRLSRRLRRLLVGVGVIAVVALLAGAVAFQQRRRADQEAFEAETARLVAESGRISVTNHRLGMLLALEAHRRAPGSETLGGLQRVFVASDQRLAYYGSEQYLGVDWLNDRQLVALTADRLDIVDLDDPTRAESVSLHEPLTVAALGENAVIVAGESSVDLVDMGSRPADVRSSVAIDSPVTALDVAPDGSVAVTQHGDGMVRAWDPDLSLRWEKMVVPEPTIGDVDYGEHADKVAAGVSLPLTTFADVTIDPQVESVAVSAGSIVRFRNLATGAPSQDDLLLLIPNPSGGTYLTGAFNLAHGADADLLFGNSTASLWAFDTTSGELRARGGNIELTALGANPIVASDPATGWYALAGGQIVRWDLGPGLQSDGFVDLGFDQEWTHLIDSAASGITGLDVTDGGHLALATDSGLVMLSATDNPLGVDVSTDVPGVGFTNRSRRWLALDAQQNGPPQLWDLDRGLDQVELGIEQGSMDAVADDLWLDSTDPTFRPTMLDGTTLERFPDPLSLASDGGIAYSRDGSVVVSVAASSRGELMLDYNNPRVFDLDPAHDFSDGFLGGQLFPAVAPNGSYFLTADITGRLVRWSTEPLEPVGDAVETGQPLSAVAILPDGERIVTAGDDGTLVIRDAGTFEEIGRLAGHTGRIGYYGGSLGIDEGGRWLVSGGNDGIARLWDLDTMTQIGDGFPTVSTPGVTSGIAQPNLVTRTDAGYRLWNLNVEQWASIGCDLVGRNLTQDEWEQFGPRGQPYRATCSQWPALG